MKTKWLMMASAIVLVTAGLGLTFLPSEIGVRIGFPASATGSLPLQLLGAAYLGMSMTNWMSRESLLGGIYGRPLVVGNLLQFFAGSMALLKSGMLGFSAAIAGTVVVWGVLAAAFGFLLFRSPVTPGNAR